MVRYIIERLKILSGGSNKMFLLIQDNLPYNYLQHCANERTPFDQVQ